MSQVRRFFSRSHNLVDGRIVLTDSEHGHISRVLRAKPGDTVIVGFGDGFDYLCRVEETGAAVTSLSVLEKQANTNELAASVTLFQCALKNDKMNIVIQKAVELGVNEIVPVVSRYVVSKNDDKSERNNRIALEASKQCRRASIVRVSREIPFSEMITRLKDFDSAIFCDEKEEYYFINTIAAKCGLNDTIAVVVGCEGGFTEQERSELKSNAVSVSLGKRTLRAETAAIFALSVISAHIDETESRV